jgi:RNA polymerase sigma factor (sigma-70 family)
MKEAELGAFIATKRQRFVEFVRRLLRSASELDPEDVVQDVLARLLLKPSLDLPVDRMTAYVYRSLRNRVVDELRTRKVHVSLDAAPKDDAQPRLIDLLADASPDAIALLQRDEGKRALFEALDRLSEIERRVVVAHELEGTSFKELASRLGMPLNTLLSHKARAMRKLEMHFHAKKEES